MEKKDGYKKIDGYNNCKNCNKEFPFRNSLKVRGIFSKKYGWVYPPTSLFCCKNCSLVYRNKYNNPAKLEYVRKLMSENAKRRGVSHLMTIEVRQKQSNSIKGSKHWNWQGGKTKEQIFLRNRKETIEWRKAVFERDNYICQICNIKSGKGVKVKLNADHIKSWAFYPELRWDLNNGRTLCVACHRRTNNYGGRNSKN